VSPLTAASAGRWTVESVEKLGFVDEIDGNRFGNIITGWWFGRCFSFFHITDFHIFQRG
jgi:hypothetical protein